MSAEHLLLLINGKDTRVSYAIMTDFDVTYAETIHHDHNNEHIPFEFPCNSVKEALNQVVNERNSNTSNTIYLPNDELTIKAFKRVTYNQVDVGRAWVISENTKNGTFNVTTEIDGLQDDTLNKASDLLPMNNLNTAVDLVGFLERVYSENNPNAGKKLTNLNAIYEKSLDILEKPFDAVKLGLIANFKKSICTARLTLEGRNDMYENKLKNLGISPKAISDAYINCVNCIEETRSLAQNIGYYSDAEDLNFSFDDKVLDYLDGNGIDVREGEMTNSIIDGCFAIVKNALEATKIFKDFGITVESTVNNNNSHLKFIHNGETVIFNEMIKAIMEKFQEYSHQNGKEANKKTTASKAKAFDERE